MFSIIVISMILGGLIYCYSHESSRVVSWLESIKQCADSKVRNKSCRKN